MSDKSTNKKTALLRLADAYASDVVSTPAVDVAAEAKEDGINVKAGAERMRDLLRRAEAKAGKARMASAKSELEIARRRLASVSGKRAASSSSYAQPANDAYELTLAARNGTEQSQRDQSTIQEDLDELDAIAKVRSEGR
jgi:hypothetical protein